MEDAHSKSMQLSASIEPNVDPQVLRTAAQVLASKEFLTEEKWDQYLGIRSKLGDYLMEQACNAISSGRLAEATALYEEDRRLYFAFGSRVKQILQLVEEDESDDPDTVKERCGNQFL